MRSYPLAKVYCLSVLTILLVLELVELAAR